MSELEIVGTHIPEHSIKDAVSQLFEEDGTIYFVTAFFTAAAYYELREDVRSFLERSPDNELVLVVGTGADQFSAFIARDLWDLDSNGQVRLYRYPRGFLHAKLYVRRGSSPAVVIGSANLTRVAFEQNLEVGAVVRGESTDDPAVRPFLEWVEDLVDLCEPLRRRDLLIPLRVVTTIRNWANKGRLFPLQHAARLVSLRGALLLAVVVWTVFGLP